MTKENYSKLVDLRSRNSRMGLDCLKAFLIGGAICTIGQGILELYLMTELSENDAKTLTSVTLIFIGVMLTALHLYERIAKHGGAGTLVPITGFANAMSSPAIEFKTEGFITGLGAKMFIIAGPVIVYGVSASIIYGMVLWVLHLFGINLF